MKKIEIELPKCSCGGEGDIIIQMIDGVVDFMWCSICGEKLPTKGE
ncbi:MAG: hypothetical protein H8D87_00230 [Deltaproteobacteria bacterium]|nr:hypothetical protein [Candidatus Desulfobacula maris]